MIIGIQGAPQKINLQIEIELKTWGSCPAFFVYGNGLFRGYKTRILNKQDDSEEIKGRKEEVKGTSPHFVVLLLCV